MKLEESFYHQMIAAYREIHENTPPFTGKDTVNFIMVGEIVKYARKLGRLEELRNNSLFGCSNCQALIDYHS